MKRNLLVVFLFCGCILLTQRVFAQDLVAGSHVKDATSTMLFEEQKKVDAYISEKLGIEDATDEETTEHEILRDYHTLRPPLDPPDNDTDNQRNSGGYEKNVYTANDFNTEGSGDGTRIPNDIGTEETVKKELKIQGIIIVEQNDTGTNLVMVKHFVITDINSRELEDCIEVGTAPVEADNPLQSGTEIPKDTGPEVITLFRSAIETENPEQTTKVAAVAGNVMARADKLNEAIFEKSTKMKSEEFEKVVADDITDAEFERFGRTLNELKQPKESITNPVTETEIGETTPFANNNPIHTATAAEAVSCSVPGVSANENDCRTYTSCTPNSINKLYKVQKTCPPKKAFDPALLRCTRDLSPCREAFDCAMEGTFADPTDYSAYYWCVANRTADGYHIYHVQCGAGQIYTPELGKCFVDMANLPNLQMNYGLYMSKSADEECVREEVKALKAEEKAQIKAVKLREKVQKKFEKELFKKAAKEAKKQAKLLGISVEDEPTFNCTQAGSFPAAMESFYDYFVCVNKKGKYKAVGMKCSQGQHFSVEQKACE